MKRQINKTALFLILAAAVFVGYLVCSNVEILKNYIVYGCLVLFAVGLFIYAAILNRLDKIKPLESKGEEKPLEKRKSYGLFPSAEEIEEAAKAECESIDECENSDESNESTK